MFENRRFLLIRRPVGTPVPADFALESSGAASPTAGKILVRNHVASLDPAQRGWMDDAPSYMPAIPLGAPVRATTVGVVAASAHPDYREGDWVVGLGALEDYSLITPNSFTRKVDVGGTASPSLYLSAFGAVGMTAYFGLIDAANPSAGETLLVSGAAGAVGSIVGQIGKIIGCRVIGIAGGADKCSRLTRDYGFDVAIDYKGKDSEVLATEIGAALPDGADILFENVGGTVFDAELMNIAPGARIVLCGLISEYNAARKVGARNLWQVLVRRATLKGFLVADYADRFSEGAQQMAEWISQGRLRIDEDEQDGLENAYAAFMRLFSGANTGKLVLRIA